MPKLATAEETVSVEDLRVELGNKEQGLKLALAVVNQLMDIIGDDNIEDFTLIDELEDWLFANSKELQTELAKALEGIGRGEYVTLDELKTELDI